MNEYRAKEVLASEIKPDGGLFSLGWYLAWDPDRDEATLDGQFTAEQLEAIAHWMRHHRAKLSQR